MKFLKPIFLVLVIAAVVLTAQTVDSHYESFSKPSSRFSPSADEIGSYLQLPVIGNLFSFSGSLENSQPQQEATPDVSYIITSTPNPDGSILHVVKEGETLWAIALAYGVTGEEIQINSGNSSQATDVYVGEVLVIKRGTPPTATNNFSPTPTRITPNPTVVKPTRTPIPTKTPFPSPTPTTIPPMTYKIFGNSQSVGLVMAGISTLGIVLVVLFGFIKKDK